MSELTREQVGEMLTRDEIVRIAQAIREKVPFDCWPGLTNMVMNDAILRARLARYEHE